MNFLGIGSLEWLIIGAIGFFVLGPKGISEGVRTVRNVMKNLREQGSELKTMVDEAVALEDEQETARNAPPAPQGAVARPAGSRPAAALPSAQPATSDATPTAASLNGAASDEAPNTPPGAPNKDAAQ